MDVWSDLSTFVVDYLPVFLAVAIIIAFMMWLLAYAARYFEYLKMLESAWFDVETLNTIHKWLVGVWVGIMAIAILIVLQFRVPEIKEGLVAFMLRFPALFVVILILFVAAVLVRILHRFAAYLRGDLKVKPKRVAPPRALSFTELFLKYFIYVSAGVLAFLGGIGALPPEDQEYKNLIFSYISPPPATVVLGLVAAIIVIFIVSRFVDSVFEDMKRQRSKYNPKAIEEFKALSKYAVYVAGAIIILVIAVNLILTQEQLLVFIVVVIMILIIGTLITFDTIRNSLAGVTLMLSDRFNVGDTVRIENGPECVVEASSLLTTLVRTTGGDTISYPNTKMLRSSLQNISRSKSGMISIDMSLGFSIPIQSVKDALIEAANKTPGIELNPPPHVYSRDIQGSCISYRLIVQTKDVLRVKEIRSELIFNIQDVFKRQNLTLDLSEN